MTNGSRVLLAGDAAARPAGLERALTRAGFLLTEVQHTDGGPDPDAILVTVAGPGEAELKGVLGEGRPNSPPLVVLIAAGDPDAPAAALALGADDALASPVHLPELCARLHARIRDRQHPRGTAREGAVRQALESLVSDARLTLRPDEVVLALVRRLARAFDLRSCSFRAVEPVGATRVVAEAGLAGGDRLLDPAGAAVGFRERREDAGGGVPRERAREPGDLGLERGGHRVLGQARGKAGRRRSGHRADRGVQVRVAGREAA